MLIVAMYESLDQIYLSLYFGPATIQDTRHLCVHGLWEVIIVVVSCFDA